MAAAARERSREHTVEREVDLQEWRREMSHDSCGGESSHLTMGNRRNRNAKEVGTRNRKLNEWTGKRWVLSGVNLRETAAGG
jgi:hypothetical protein